MHHSSAAVIEGAAVVQAPAAHRGSACNDTLLVERFLAGENAAFVELYDRHHRPLALYCSKMLAGHDAFDDVMQELWMRVLRLRGKGRQRIDHPVGFLFRIARNLCLNHIAARRHHVPLTELPEDAHPLEMQTMSDLEEQIVAALDRLAFEHREVLVLHVYCGYRFEEIAGMIGCTADAAWKRASRARRRLRELVLQNNEPESSKLEGAQAR